VTILEGTPATAIELGGDRVVAVQTPEGRIATPLVVNAAGPQAPLIGRMAGVEVPVDPRRRHIFVTDEFAGVRHPMPLVIDRKSGFYCRSEQRQILMSAGDVGAETEFSAAVDWSMLDQAVDKAVRRIPALEGASIRHAWAGLRPLTPDEHAILDWAPGLRGLYLAVGFCGHGFQHSPATGQVVSEILTGAPASIDVTDLSLARFAGGIPRHQPRLGVG
jgi:sarcosine oxidase subunit beta